MIIAICDDERIFRERLVQLIRLYSAESGVPVEYCTFSSGKELLGSERSFDVIILDYMMDGINGIDYHFSVFDKNPGWIEQARAHDMSINVWTVNDSTDIQRMIDFGVDCITTNEPLRVRGMLDGNEFVIK